jgi:hypothetical protein
MLRAASTLKTSKTRKMTTKMSNRIRAILAPAADMPVNPKTAAIIEIRKNISAHLRLSLWRVAGG